MIGVDALQIPVLGQIEKSGVGHAQLLSLKNIGRALHQIKAQAQHFCRDITVFGQITAEFGHGSRLVVIAPEQAVPRGVSHFRLPMVKHLLQGRERRFPVGPFSVSAVCQPRMLKGKDHIQLIPVSAGIFFGFLHRNTGALPHGHHVITGQYLSVHFPQIFMYAGTVDAGGGEIRFLCPGDRIRFGDQADHIHAEAVHAFFKPPGHHFINFLPQLRIFPVQVRLLFCENVQIVGLCLRVVFPGRAAEPGLPVVGLFLTPDVIIPVRVDPALPAFLKPCMLIGRVVHHQIHNNAYAPAVGFRQKAVKVLHGPEVRIDGVIVADVIAIVRSGGGIDRA